MIKKEKGKRQSRLDSFGIVMFSLSVQLARVLRNWRISSIEWNMKEYEHNTVFNLYPIRNIYSHVSVYLALGQCQRKESVQSCKVLSTLAVIQQSTQLCV